MKNIISLFVIILLFNACNSGVSDSTQKQIDQQISSWNSNKTNLESLEHEISKADSSLKKMLQDSLGEQGLQFIEKDSLSNQRIKSLQNDLQNLKADYTNLMANYTTLIKETQDWSSKLSQSKQSTEEINEEWESKQRQIQEILSQKDAYEQALQSIIMSYNQAISDIKKKMNKK